ncbi:MAG: TonB-dependent receptor [Bacteroidetes bacterium]|nr:TonB-dependent receptor [Bacteroidota bacterium]
MKRKKILCIIFVLFFGVILPQQKFTISGRLKDKSTSEVLIGAMVKAVEINGLGAVSNAYGFYSFTLPEGKHRLIISMAGYAPIDTSITFNSSLNLDFELSEKSTQLSEVEVSTNKLSDDNVTSTQMSAQTLNIKEIKNVPVFFGEKDILKTIQLLPGITNVADGTSGFYVRGGSADQNLILLDEAIVYNPTHLLGFFSVFNSDAIKDVTIYKGGIPAQYGGRISSVLDVKMNDGNAKKLSVSGGLGLISSRLTVEGPINKGKGSFIISGRRTYADLFLKAFGPKNLRGTSLYFYDFNLKANYELTAHDRVYLSGYFGKDNFIFSNNNASNRSFGINWGNATGTLRWNHIFGDKLFLNSNFIFTNYRSNVVLGSGDAQFQVSTGIQDFSIKEDFNYYLNNKHSVKFGLQSIYHTFIPGEVTINTSSSTNLPTRLNRTIERKHAIENAVYFADDYNAASWLKINYGFRLSTFTTIGPNTVYNYDSNGNIVDSVIYKANQPIVTYVGYEPRAGVTFIVSPQSSIKVSYNHINQYLHLLSNTTSSTPVDIWVPCSQIVKPQIGDQYAVGYFRNFKNNTIETSVEGFYKNMQNQIDYINGADLRFNKTVESQLVFGKGKAYGVEFFIKKKEGRFTGWVSYTLSRTFRQFDSLNYGNEFPAKQDIINNLSVVGMYKLNEKITFSATFVFHTGFAATFPSGKYQIGTQVVNYYTERNGYRMPTYHRLDLGLTLQGKKTAKFESDWNFSIYNAYGRENPYSITFQPDPNNPNQMQAVQLSLFRWVPSITYNFKF